MICEVRPATLADIRVLARTLREPDRIEITGSGLAVRHGLHSLFQRSLVCRTALVDDEVAAVGGMVGVMLDDTAFPWLFTTPAIERAPLFFVRGLKREIAEMLTTRRRLSTRVLASYRQSVRLFGSLGFTFSEPYPVIPDGPEFRDMILERN